MKIARRVSNWTSTRTPMWQLDGENFRRILRPFELRDVTDPEHMDFIEQLCQEFGWKQYVEGKTVRFELDN